jgi:hypothetical protein
MSSYIDIFHMCNNGNEPARTLGMNAFALGLWLCTSYPRARMGVAHPHYINKITVLCMVVFGFTHFCLPPLAHNSETRNKGTVSVSKTRAHGHPCDFSTICAIAPSETAALICPGHSCPSLFSFALASVSVLGLGSQAQSLIRLFRLRRSRRSSVLPLPLPLFPVLDGTLALLSTRSAWAAFARSSVLLPPVSLFWSWIIGLLIMSVHNTLTSPTHSLSPLHHGFLLPQEPAHHVTARPHRRLLRPAVTGFFLTI